MNKLCKTITPILLMIMIIFTTGTVKAAQSTKVEDVIQYISSVHKIRAKIIS